MKYLITLLFSYTLFGMVNFISHHNNFSYNTTQMKITLFNSAKETLHYQLIPLEIETSIDGKFIYYVYDDFSPRPSSIFQFVEIFTENKEIALNKEFSIKSGEYQNFYFQLNPPYTPSFFSLIGALQAKIKDVPKALVISNVHILGEGELTVQIRNFKEIDYGEFEISTANEGEIATKVSIQFEATSVKGKSLFKTAELSLSKMMPQNSIIKRNFNFKNKIKKIFSTNKTEKVIIFKVTLSFGSEYDLITTKSRTLVLKNGNFN